MKDRFIKVASQEAKRVFTTGRFLTLTLGPDSRDLDRKGQFLLMSKVWGRFVKRVNAAPTHHVKCKQGRLCPACIAGKEPCGARTIKLNGRSKSCRARHLCDKCLAGPKGCGKIAVPRFKDFTAIWVREAHKDGAPHLHCLVDRFIPQKWVSKTWEECGGGPVVDIRRAPIGRVVAYVTKYLAKTLGQKHPDVGNGDGLKGIRRYGTVGAAKLVGIYPVKRGTDPWRIWYKPGLEQPRDWTPVMRGEEKYAIAWVTMHFGEGKADPTVAQRFANSIRDRMARLRASQASQQQFERELTDDRIEELQSFWDNRRREEATY